MCTQKIRADELRSCKKMQPMITTRKYPTVSQLTTRASKIKEQRKKVPGLTNLSLVHYTKYEVKMNGVAVCLGTG